MPNRTILLIDYDPQSIESAIKPLTSAGYTVEVANDGIAGLQAFERLRPDLVLIEPMVPKKHGFEVCQEIKGSDQGRSTPVLITTGFYRGRKHEVEAKQFYGCDEYLEKPIAEELLLSTCERYLADEPDEPRLLEDLEAELPATARVPEDGLPDLEELSEEEIVARLDDLIKEEPAQAGTEPEPPPIEDDAAAAAQAAPEPAESAIPLAEPVPEFGTAETGAEEPSPVFSGDAPLPLGGPVRVTYGAPGTGAEAPDPEPIPEKEPVIPDEISTSSSKQLWLVAAAALLIVVIGAGIIFGPRLFNGDEGAGIASTTARPLGKGPATARRPALVKPAEPTGPPATLAETATTEKASDEAPTSSSEPAATPSRSDARRGEPASRPEPRQTRSESARNQARPRTARPALPPPDPAPAEPRATSSVREQAPAREETRSVEAKTDQEPQATPTLTGDSSTQASRPADPVPEPPTEGAPAVPEDPTLTASGSEGAGVEPEPTPSLATPSADPSAEGRLPARSAPAVEETAPPEPPPVARGTLLDISQVDTLPQPLDKRPPEYPPLARRLRLEGTVSLRLLVDERGRVTEVEPTAGKTNTVLVKAAERAAREWTYHPATKGGVPVKVWITERVVFQR